MVKKLPKPAPAVPVAITLANPHDVEIAQLRAQLAVSEARYQELAENVPGVLYRWRKNPDGTYTPLYTSPKLYELFGLTLDDVRHLGDFVHPDDQQRWEEAVALATASGQPVPSEFEARLLVPGQPLRWWRSRALRSVTDELGIVYSGFMEDVTALRRQEEAARHGQMRQRLAVVGLGDGSWEYDYTTQRATISPEVRAMLGYSVA